LSSTGVSRLSTAALRVARATPFDPKKKQDDKENMKNAADPSAVFFRLWGSRCRPRTPKMVAAESPADSTSNAAAVSSLLLKDTTMSSATTTNQKAP